MKTKGVIFQYGIGINATSQQSYGRREEEGRQHNTIVLKAPEYMLHKRIAKKKLEIHKYRERTETDKRVKH